MDQLQGNLKLIDSLFHVGNHGQEEVMYKGYISFLRRLQQKAYKSFMVLPSHNMQQGLQTDVIETKKAHGQDS